MVVNFLRTAVGCDSVASLAGFQKAHRMMRDRDGAVTASLFTRRTPTRANDLINGGSVYWIINRFIQARQEIVDVATVKDEDGRDICRILIKPDIIMISPMPHRHIQGWRYLDPAKAPADIGLFDPDDPQDMPDDPQMREELKALGLI